MLKIKELRVEKGIDQQTLAQALKIGKGSISNWEVGRTEPSIDYILSLADYFEVSTDYLLGRSNDIGVVQTNANLTQFENILLSVVNSLSRDDQFQVLGFAKSLAK